MDLKKLAELLEVEGTTVHIDESDNYIYIRWEHESLEPGGVHDFQYPNSVAEATVRKLDEGVEWEKFFVQNTIKGHGIFTTSMSLPYEFSVENDMWPHYIDPVAPEADFYRRAGFDYSPEKGMLVKNQERADAWVKEQRQKNADS